MWTELSTTMPVARKVYRCIWCDDHIYIGDLHVKTVGIFDGDFQNQRFHRECEEACGRLCNENHGSVEFMPGEFKRGTTEEQ